MHGYSPTAPTDAALSQGRTEVAACRTMCVESESSGPYRAIAITHHARQGCAADAPQTLRGPPLGRGGLRLLASLRCSSQAKRDGGHAYAGQNASSQIGEGIAIGGCGPPRDQPLISPFAQLTYENQRQPSPSPKGRVWFRESLASSRVANLPSRDICLSPTAGPTCQDRCGAARHPPPFPAPSLPCRAPRPPRQSASISARATPSSPWRPAMGAWRQFASSTVARRRASTPRPCASGRTGRAAAFRRAPRAALGRSNACWKDACAPFHAVVQDLRRKPNLPIDHDFPAALPVRGPAGGVPAHARPPRRGRPGPCGRRASPSAGRCVLPAASSDDALAMQRYRDAFGRLGAGHSRYVYEPVGAAFSFARNSRPRRDRAGRRFRRRHQRLLDCPLFASGRWAAGRAARPCRHRHRRRYFRRPHRRPRGLAASRQGRPLPLVRQGAAAAEPLLRHARSLE